MNKNAMNDFTLNPYNAENNNEGTLIGTPTVKDLIALLSKLPQDYSVTCCGAEAYLYLMEDSQTITIDCESYLA